MYTLCWSVKGGSGVTVVAAALALVSANVQPTLLIDLGGDLAAALGVTTPPGPGVGEWLASPHATAGELLRLGFQATQNLTLVCAGSLRDIPAIDDVGAERLAHAIASMAGAIIVDAGRHYIHGVLHACASRSLMVVRPCYLALGRAARSRCPATAAVVVLEPGRSLGTADVERAAAAPIAATIPWDPAIARTVDSGMTATRLPGSLSKPLARLARELRAGSGVQ
jgi:hypothetical protein